MRITAEITAVCITIEEDNANWTPDAIETLTRIAADEAMRVYRTVEIPEGFALE